MPSPLVLVSDGGGPFNPAAPTGVNVTPGNTITVKLASETGVNRGWSLTVFGLDDLRLASPPAASTSQEVVGFFSIPLDAPTWGAPVDKAAPLFDVASGKVKLRGLIPSDVAAAFAPTLAVANGAPTIYEVGNVTSPTFTVTPATNS